jgi:glycosyltransferase involved in cell wall biosynthesis
MSKIRAALDASPLLLRSAGVKTYLHYWSRSLLRTAGVNRLFLFPHLDNGGTFTHEGSILPPGPTLARIAVLQSANYLGAWVSRLATPRVDVFHTSNQLRNPPRNARLTTTLHDLTCWLMPEVHSKGNVKVDRDFARRVIRRADGLIAVSRHTRDDAIRVLGISPDRIEVIYPGIADAFFTVTRTQASQTAAKYGLHKKYVLFVGTVEPRKNLDRLLQGWAMLPADCRAEFELVVAGPAGWGDPAVLQCLRGGLDGVRYLGYLPEADMPGITKGALAVAYPSLYEGFGFPVAQAMAAGVAVITSAISSLPEVAGDGALLVDPQSVGEIRSALEKVMTSPVTVEHLGRNGAERARSFTWENCARQSWAFFERVCGG